ncbi:MAG TPA: hypothetical protein VN028_03675 [Rhodocyclaceae bacterium]|nr:hypothetical protein [Rhodocyclaceae bacterium]
MSRGTPIRSTDLVLVPLRPCCPICHRATYRVHRRLLDLIINLFVPILRFRCCAIGCDWEGNVRTCTIGREATRR